ncbi:MAG: hypothetical protein PHE78_04240 [Candidatus Gastranaerophilales bacterium]|nr:hypothetical protein [Candidatus Gastranaerophilales bacterium]
MKFFKVAILIFTLCTAQMAMCQTYTSKNPPSIKREYNLQIPSGIFLKAIVQSEISTKTNNINDPVRAIIDNNFYFMDAICIPENSIITGRITEFQLPKKGRNGLFRLHFDSLTFPNGKQIPFDGELWADGSNMIGGQPSALTETREVPFCASGMNYLLLKPTGEYSVGKDVTLSAGSEILIKTNTPIKVNFTDYQ